MVSRLVDEDAGNRTSEEEIVSGSEGPDVSERVQMATVISRLTTAQMVVTNWHFSHSFCLIILNIYDPHLFRFHLVKLTTLVSYHFACSLCSQIKKTRVLIPKRSQHDVYTTTGDPFQSKTKTRAL